jgi:hypothetical protein
MLRPRLYQTSGPKASADAFPTSDTIWSDLATRVAPATTMGIAATLLLLTIVSSVLLYNIQSNVGALTSGAVERVQINGSSCGVVSETRRNRAYTERVQVAYANYIEPVSDCHTNNGDEALYSSTHFASYSKGLTHDSLGHVDPDAYTALARAAASGLPSDWDAVPLAAGAARELTNPQAGWAYTLQGADPQSFPIPAPPTFASAEQAGEFVENAWMAYARDVPFALYASNARTLAAVAEISALTDFRGPPVLASSLFRGTSPGCSTGPYISQFLYLPCSMGPNAIDQRILPLTTSLDFMITMSDYLLQQEVQTPLVAATYEATPVYIHTLRDLATWVHDDVLFQAYFMAMLSLQAMNATLKPSIPYVTTSLNQQGFATWGSPFLASMSTAGAVDALKAAWFLKWGVNRRLRPEVFGARLHNHKTGAYTYPIHVDAVNSTIVDLIYGITGTYLLPMAFPEGSPNHPSYPAGHATVAGVSVTILKALYVEETVITGNLMPSADGTTTETLDPTATLTVGGELNKLAWNIALGRNGAGAHWRSDATESLLLGERIAVRLLRDLMTTFPEPLEPLSFTDFAGNVVVVA